jgi:hypothetical protein
MDGAAIIRLTANLLPRVVLVAGPVAWLVSAVTDLTLEGGDAALLLGAVVIVLGSILVDGFATALAVGIADGSGIRVGAALGVLRARAGTLIGASIVLFLITSLVVLPVLAIYASRLPADQAPTPTPSGFGSADFAGLLGLSLLVRLATIRWILVTPIAMFGTQGAVDTLRGSWRATTGLAVPLLLLFVPFDLVYAVVTTGTEGLAWPLNRASDFLLSPLISTMVVAAWLTLGRPVSASPAVEEAQ